MKEDLQKFMNLMQADESLQKKMEEAYKKYDGEQTEEAVFNSVVAPIIKEAGYSLTLDDLKQSVRELDLDEMDQVAGGVEAYSMEQGGGVGINACGGFGVGFGWAAAAMDDDLTMRGAFCILIGYGEGGGICLTAGCVLSGPSDNY